MSRFAVGCALAAALSAPAATQAKGQRGPHVALSAQDQQRRREAAAELHRQGLDVDWRLASWAELRDWSTRAAEARALREESGVLVDWRACELSEIREWRARIARAADLRRFGIDADWRLFTARQLDDLRVFLEHAHDDAGVSAVAPVAGEAGAGPETRGFDPDAPLLPTYMFEELTAAADDDGILEASFSPAHAKLRNEDPAARPSAMQRKRKAGKSARAPRRRADI